MIIPKQFLKTIKRTGLGAYLFHEMRTLEDQSINNDFILNQKPYNSSEILVSAANFGCGSSREHAPWALFDYGIRCVIAPSFADIFYNNCFENGILPAIITETQKNDLINFIIHNPQEPVSVDLPAEEIRYGSHIITFTINDFRKKRLLEGLDSIGLSLQHHSDITAHEAERAKNMPWLSSF